MVPGARTVSALATAWHTPVSAWQREVRITTAGLLLFSLGGRSTIHSTIYTFRQATLIPARGSLFSMGSRHRMALALQVSDIGDIAQEIQLILKAKPPTDLREGWSLLKQGIHLLHARPKQAREAPCQEVVTILDTGFSMLDEKSASKD